MGLTPPLGGVYTEPDEVLRMTMMRGAGCGHLAPGIRHLASGIWHPASGIRHPASGIRHPKKCDILQFWVLSVIYSAGLRRSELVNLRITDIDSKRMLIHIRQSKGAKDRVVGLSKKVLALLREYFTLYKPQYYLFEGQGKGKHSGTSINLIFQRAKKNAGIKTNGGVHMLQHSYATHLHESGYDIRIIQELLGHRSSKTTEIYTHISTKSIKNVVSPFDDL